MKREGVTIDTANLEIAEELPPLRVPSVDRSSTATTLR